MKLTKQQQKENARIDAWIKGKPFQENSSSKPVMQDLDLEYVLEHYTPDHPEYTAQYFTPLEASLELAGYVTNDNILEPSAGIGSLLYYMDWADEITCIELDPVCYAIGKKLFPKANWILGNALEREVERKYNAVVLGREVTSRIPSMPM